MISRTWGSTEAERALSLPCDEHLPDADDTLWRALDVHAPAPLLFRWLCQLRVAPYSYDWIDNRGHRSPRALTPGLDELAVGQSFLSIFVLVGFEPGRQITLSARRGQRLFGQVATTYAVNRRGERACRLLVKMRVRHATPLQRALLPWGDLVMMRRQMLNLRTLAERQADEGPTTGSDRQPLGWETSEASGRLLPCVAKVWCFACPRSNFTAVRTRFFTSMPTRAGACRRR